MDLTETRQVGKHLFIFEKGDGTSLNKNARTLITSCLDTPPNTDQKLPPEFVKYMKKLFGILDQEKRGFVRLKDIEARWRAKGTTQLGAQSANVLDSLRRVTPSSGVLSFDRLCLGFQLALQATDGIQEPPRATEILKGGRQDTETPHTQCSRESRKELEDLEPVQRMRPRRPRSMVQLRQQTEPLDLSLAKRKGGILEGIGKTDKRTVVEKLRELQREGRPREKNGKLESSVATVAASSTKAAANSRRRDKTPEWKGNKADRDSRSSPSNNEQNGWLPRVRVHYQGAKLNGVTKNGLNGGSRDTTVHGTGNGVMVAKESKLKYLDEELKVFGEGLRAVENIRDWFFTRITALQEEKLYVKSVSKYCYQDYEAAIHAKRRQDLGLNRLNCDAFSTCVEKLKTCFEQTMKAPSASQTTENLESERKIAQLEKDKQALIRELFQCKSQQDKYSFARTNDS